jgi:transposase-like protein
MKLHRNARTTPVSRAQCVARVLRAGWTYQQAADGSGISRRTVAKWVQRFREAGPPGARRPVVTAATHPTHHAGPRGDADSSTP